MSIGSRLRQLRLKNRLTQEQVGEICGVTKGMISQWESGIATPPTDRLLELRKHLVFSLDWLMRGEGPVEQTEYTIRDPKLIAICKIMEGKAEYVKDAAVKEIAQMVELVEHARAGDVNSGTHG